MTDYPHEPTMAEVAEVLAYAELAGTPGSQLAHLDEHFRPDGPCYAELWYLRDMLRDLRDDVLNRATLIRTGEVAR